MPTRSAKSRTNRGRRGSKDNNLGGLEKGCAQPRGLQRCYHVGLRLSAPTFEVLVEDRPICGLLVVDKAFKRFLL
jgi:hypothetical protein